jgi:colanic acid biosynthesis protein WcaH
MYLNDDDFLDVIKKTPLIAVDLLYVHNGSILLGQRKNKPAKDFWFVPGGRIRKLESIERAIERVAKTELGIDTDPHEHGLVGAFEHMYENCVFGDQTHTHYICLAFAKFISELPEDIHTGKLEDDQHDNMLWWGIDIALGSPLVHEYTKNYIRAIKQIIGAKDE